MYFRLQKLAALFLVAFILTGCGGSKTVVTQDDSADYSAAKTLPPLRKPGRSVVTEPNPVVEPLQPGSPAADGSSNADGSSKQAYVAQPSLTRNPSTKTKQRTSKVSASVIEVEESVRLRIDASLNQAWSFLSANLKNSDITVHNRNRAAGRISIGCGSVEATAKTSSGWSIFRKKERSTEHCSLQVVERRSQTIVTVLNRSGLEVAAIDAKKIFTRLLNN